MCVADDIFFFVVCSRSFSNKFVKTRIDQFNYYKFRGVVHQNESFSVAVQAAAAAASAVVVAAARLPLGMTSPGNE